MTVDHGVVPRTGRPRTEPANRRTTAIRFRPVLYESLQETAEELGVSINWLVQQFCEEGLANMDLAVLRGNFMSARDR